MTDPSFSDEELGAYLDGELPQARRTAVAAFLAANPEHARRIEAYRADGDAIARMFAGVDQHRQAPQSSQSESRRAGLGSSWRRAAVIGLFVAGALASLVWSFAPSGRPDDLRRFGDLAAAAYSTRPASLNVSLGEASQLISRSLSSTVAFRDPAGSGYEVIGSRVIDDGGIAQVQLVFRDRDGATVTMYLAARPGAPDTAFIVVPGTSSHTTLVWVDDQIACAVSGPLPADRLEAAARLIYKHLLS